MKIATDIIFVEFVCEECKNIIQVSVTDIIEVGPPLCPKCLRSPEMCYGDAIIKIKDKNLHDF